VIRGFGGVMGDGRYYSMAQFLNIAVLLLLISLSVVSCVYSYYKNDKDSRNKMSLLIFIQILTISILRFIEEVIPSIIYAKKLRGLENVFVILVLFFISMYLYRIVLKSNNNNNRTLQGKLSIPLVVMTIAIVALILDLSLIITGFVRLINGFD